MNTIYEVSAISDKLKLAILIVNGKKETFDYDQIKFIGFNKLWASIK